MKDRLRRWRDEIAIAALLAALAAALALGGWAWRADRLVYDLGLALAPRAVPDDIVIIAIDDASLDAIGRWPWKRAVHATLLEKIAALPPAQRPRAIALDLVLSEPDPDPAQDRLLAQAVARAAPVVLPLPGAPADPALRGGARLGAAEPAVDADGVLRHAYLWNVTDSGRLPHVALALLEAAGGSAHPRLRPRSEPGSGAYGRRESLGGPYGHRDGEIALRFIGPPGSVRRVSYVDLLTGAEPASGLAGRLVLIGMTAQGLGDTLATPVNARHRAMPGVEVLANVLYTLKSGDAPQPVPDTGLAAASALALAALVAALARFGARAGLALTLAAVALAVAASLWALAAGTWASPVPFALPALLAYPLWGWRRLERAAAAQQARQLLASTLAAAPTAMLVAGADGRVRLANAQAAALFDVAGADELQGLDLPRLLAEFDTGEPRDWPATLGALLPGAPGLALQARGSAGGDHMLHAAALTLDGQRGWVVALTDIATVKAAEREREEALAFVSHDLRAPASSIVLLADLHGRGVATPGDTVAEMGRLAQRTLALADDFVRAAQAQRTPLRLAPVALPALLEEALADLQPQAAAAGVALQPQPDPGRFTLDRRLVARAVTNLVTNALKQAPAGSAVDVLAALDGQGALRIEVADRGPGLGAAQLAQLSRGNAGVASGDRRGVGLGLLFVQRVAQRHGGSLQAALREGGGTVFVLCLPPASGNP